MLHADAAQRASNLLKDKTLDAPLPTLLSLVPVASLRVAETHRAENQEGGHMRRVAVVAMFTGLVLGGRILAPADPIAASPCTILMSSRSTGPMKSGYCAHHGGVCGCSGGRAKCCDGTLSPSCGC
jgi:hypothetical protein